MLIGIVSITLGALLSSPISHAKLKASIAQLPVLAESNERGILIDLLKAMRAANKGQLDYDVVPFNQSLNGTLKGHADFHIPLLKEANSGARGPGFTYSRESLWQVTFALYTNKAKKIDLQALKQANIETESTHVQFFPEAKPSQDVADSLARVNSGVLDGFIFAALECDEIIKRNSLSNIESHKYKTFDVKFIVPNGQRGESTEKSVERLIAKIRANGEFDKIMSPITNFYRNWEPTAKP